MNLKELEDKKEYLNNLRSFTEEEKENINQTVIKKNIHPYSNKSELEGIKDVYHYINYIMREESSFPYPKGYKRPLTEELLQEINRTILYHYSFLLPCEKGFYRLGINDKINNIILPPQEVFIPRLQKLIDCYEKTNVEYIKKLTYFHLEFLCNIHPFYDGNGRTARAFMNLELARLGYPMIGLKYGNINEYYEAIQKYIEQKDACSMENLIIKEINNELDNQILIKKRR